MASGLAVLAADAPGSRDIVRDGVDGVLCPPNDRDAFARTLRRMIENPDVRTTMRQNALQRAASFRWDIVLDEMVRNYRKAVGEGE